MNLLPRVRTVQLVRRWSAAHWMELLWLLLVIAYGSELRLVEWGEYWLNADEGLHWSIAAGSLGSVAQQFLGNAHPPLYYYCLHALWSLGLGIDGLRMLSLVSGILLIPAVHWLGRTWGGPYAGAVAGLLVATSPGAIVLSQLLRNYALMSLLAALALGSFEQAFRLRKARWWVAFAVLLGLALLTSYSVWVLLGGVTLIALQRIVELRPKVRELLLMSAGFGVLFALSLFLYLFHVRGLASSELRKATIDTWLAPQYGFEGALGNLVSSAHYTLGGPWPLSLMLLAFVAPFLTLRSRPAHGSWMVFAVAVVAIVCSGFLIFPLGPSRHSIYMLVVLAPACGVAFAELMRSRRTLVLAAGAAALIALPAINIQRAGLGEHFAGLGQERVLRRVVAEQFRRSMLENIGPDDLVVMDHQTAQQIVPLLGEAPSSSYQAPGILHLRSRGITFAEPLLWAMTGDQLVSTLETLVTTHPESPVNPRPGRVVWLTDGGQGLLQLVRTLPPSCVEPVASGCAEGDLLCLARIDVDCLLGR